MKKIEDYKSVVEELTQAKQHFLKKAKTVQ